MIETDFLVIGAGMAGASVAHELAADASVILLEREPQPAYHSTGRSAALFSEIYGNGVVRALSRLSHSFLRHPPAGFVDAALLGPRGAMYVASAAQRAAFDEFRAAPDVATYTRAISTQEALDIVPILKPECAVYAAYEPGAADVDVHALHQGYLKGLRARGARVICNVAIDGIERLRGRWHVTAGKDAWSARMLVNASGAWADVVASLAGAGSIGLVPMRRTALLIDPPAGVNIERWPLVINIDEDYYFKPDAGKLLLSPADETPTEPCDVQPDDYDVALAVDRVEQATTLTINRVSHRWAGLRSFVADRAPVAGFDAQAEGFFWLAGQGGYGIQTAPALARFSATLLLGRALDGEFAAAGLSPEILSPLRLRSASAARA